MAPASAGGCLEVELANVTQLDGRFTHADRALDDLLQKTHTYVAAACNQPRPSGILIVDTEDAWHAVLDRTLVAPGDRRSVPLVARRQVRSGSRPGRRRTSTKMSMAVASAWLTVTTGARRASELS